MYTDTFATPYPWKLVDVAMNPIVPVGAFQAAMTLVAVDGVAVALNVAYFAAVLYMAPVLPDRNTTTDTILRYTPSTAHTSHVVLAGVVAYTYGVVALMGLP